MDYNANSVIHFFLLSVDPGVKLIHADRTIGNGSVLSIEAVGENEEALLCHTRRKGCCAVDSNSRIGEWYYPNSTIVPNCETNHNFYRNRNNSGYVFLHQKNHESSATGEYCCELPDSYDNCGINQTLCIILGTMLL